MTIFFTSASILVVWRRGLESSTGREEGYTCICLIHGWWQKWCFCKNRDNSMILFKGSIPADFFQCRRHTVVSRHLMITESAREGRRFVLSKFGSNLNILTGFINHMDVVVQCTPVDERASTRVWTLIVATIYLQLIQNRYLFRSFTLLQCSHQHCVQPVASDVEVVGYI